MVKTTEAISFLLENQGKRFWNYQLRPEIELFLKKQYNSLPKTAQKKIVSCIMKGPPINLKNAELDDEEWRERTKRYKYFYLRMMINEGFSLPPKAKKFYSETKLKYLVESKLHEKPPAPPNFIDIKLSDLMEWFEENESDKYWDTDPSWQQFCSDQKRVAFDLLNKLALENEYWDAKAWQPMFNDNVSQTEDKGFEKSDEVSVSELIDSLMKMPSKVLRGMGVSTARWLEKHWNEIKAQSSRKKIWLHLWNVFDEDFLEPQNITFDQTLNNSSGILAIILIREQAIFTPLVNAGEQPGFQKFWKPLFDKACKNKTTAGEFARMRFAYNLLYLFRIDDNWTKKNLISRMDVNASNYEPNLWKAFLWNARYGDDMIPCFSPYLLEYLKSPRDDDTTSYAKGIEMLTYMSIYRGDLTNLSQVKDCFKLIRSGDLVFSVHALNSMLRQSGEKSDQLWLSKIQPWLSEVWPKSQDVKSKELTDEFVRLVTNTGDSFGVASKFILDFIDTDQNGFSLYSFKSEDDEKKIIENYPIETLELVHKLVADSETLYSDSLRSILDKLIEVRPSFKNRVKYTDLKAKID